MRAHRLLLPVAAFLAILPLLLHGPSCGHDFDFHLLNWLEAAHQIAHGHYPHWAYIPAYNAGEPRFLFYPPLSWLLGALLTATLPFRFTPAAYTFTCLTLSGFTFYRLARLWTSESAATLAAVFYLLNPCSLFTAYERTAYAELLAAAWIPLLFAAILRPRPTVPGIATPLALLWLTNAPAAVMSTYALALLTLVRLIWTPAPTRAPFIASLPHAMSGSPAPDPTDSKLETLFDSTLNRSRLTLARTAALGTTLGLALPAFYLLPAAYEQRWVEIDMAILEGLRPADNFLFHHTPDAAHDAVLHTASVIAVLLLALSAATLFFARKQTPRSYLFPALASLAAAIAFLLTPWSAPLWNHLPELRFLQFPWRTLALLACTAALAAAIATRNLKLRPRFLIPTSFALAAILVFHPSPHRDPGVPLLTPEFTHGCEPAESPIGRQQLTPALANTGPTDEYTPIGVDNDQLHPGDPAFWTTSSLNAAPPPSLPAAGAPDHLTLTVPQATLLILNRRWFPAWRITLNGREVQPETRDDGLIALALPAGQSTVDLTFTETPDRLLGLLISLLALLVLLILVILRYRRRTCFSLAPQENFRG